MKNLLKTLPLLALILLFTASVGHAQGSATGPTSVSVTVGPEASLTVTSPTALATTGTVFNNYTGTTTVTYLIRTTQSGGTGSITLKVTSDFSPATGGPSVTTPPTAGDALKYTCSGAAPATACSGSQTPSTSTTTPVATFGADAHTTSASGSTVTTSWTLTNDPVYKTGTYSATVTFTISAAQEPEHECNLNKSKKEISL
ncbi:MAG: hypothetical protein ABSA41_07060 [Terriglobia bacterium]